MFLANHSSQSESNQTDTHKSFLTESEDFFLTRVRNRFLALFFFRVEQVKIEFEELKIEWFDPVDSTDSVESLLFFLPFLFLLGVVTLSSSQDSSALLLETLN